MSEQYQGVVHKVLNRNGRWSLLMNNDEWYGLGRKAPVHKDGSQVTEGDTVRFKYEDNTKNGRTFHNVVDDTLQAKKGDGPPPTSGNSQSRGSRGGRSNYQAKEKYWEDKEKRDIDTQKKISMAGAYNTALQTLGFKFNEGLIKFSGKSLAAKIEAFDAMLHDEACRLYHVINLTPEHHDEIMVGEKDKAAEPLEEDLDEPAEEGDDWGEEDGEGDDW